jgi:hypothetical protein
MHNIPRSLKSKIVYAIQYLVNLYISFNRRAKRKLTPAQMKKRHKKRQRKLRAVKREQLLDFRRSFCDMLSAHITKTAGEAYWRWTSRQN